VQVSSPHRGPYVVRACAGRQTAGCESRRPRHVGGVLVTRKNPVDHRIILHRKWHDDADK
jgi:hypothetical protein